MKSFTSGSVVVIPMVIALLVSVGCDKPSEVSATSTLQCSTVGTSNFLLSTEPSGAKGVIDLRMESKDKDDVVMIGRIGGADQPWVEGRAAFVVIDPSVGLCEEAGNGVCACCQDKVGDATALVKVVDNNGQLLKGDARDLFNVKGNELVVVSGVAKRDDAGNLTILANGVYVRN
jgi:hypothetical protein